MKHLVPILALLVASCGQPLMMGAPTLGQAQSAANDAVVAIGKPGAGSSGAALELFGEAGQAATALREADGSPSAARLLAIAASEDVCGLRATLILEPSKGARLDRDALILDSFASQFRVDAK